MWLWLEQAIEAGSYLTDPLRLTSGDMSALASSALRFDGELTHYDTVRTYANNCAFALEMLAEHPNLQLILDKQN